jgi:transposase
MKNSILSLQPDQISTMSLDHLGLVAATIDDLNLIDKIDQILPLSQDNGVKATMGQRVAAMILNGLGFINNRLYIFPEFLSNKPVERLLGQGVSYEHFNDDALGRCLDAIYENGPTNTLSSIAFQIGLEKKLLGKSIHFDTTTIRLTGDYQGMEDENFDLDEADPKEKLETKAKTNKESESFIASALTERPIPKYGYSKDHRPDLKQMVLNLATTGASGFPIWMEAHSGNASDKKTLYEGAHRMKEFAESLKESNRDYSDFLVIGDSAMYDACVNNASNIFWLTRVPESHKEAKKYLEKTEEEIRWIKLENGYKIQVFDTEYKKVQQRWCLVFSEKAYERETETLNKRIHKQKEETNKKLKKFMGKEFDCELDAKKGIKEFEKALKSTYYKIRTWSVEEIKKHKKSGRPKKGSQEICTGYRVVGQISENEEKIENKKRTRGRFILGTNQMNKEKIADKEILSEYKEQSKVEGGFKLLKDASFQIASVFLKKPERIAGLMMVMTLCLMVYALAQYKLRQALEAKRDTVETQTKKQTNKPTLKWIFNLFQGIQIVSIKINGKTQEIVSNINETRRKIIEYFGPKAMEIYRVSPIRLSG